MYHITERNERQSKRHALALAIALHLALVSMLYFKLSGDSTYRPNDRPVKVNMSKERPSANAKTLQLP
ncbi:MAG: hypothetical protein ACKVT2_13875 [Saprospiraceae bacterium]